jgi:hypothetical protein
MKVTHPATKQPKKQYFPFDRKSHAGLEIEYEVEDAAETAATFCPADSHHHALLLTTLSTEITGVTWMSNFTNPAILSG